MLDQLWFTGEVRSLTGPIRGKGEFVTGGGLYGYEISAGRAGPEGTRLNLSLKTDERPLTVEADGLLAFERGGPRFDGALTLSRPAGAVLAGGKAVAFEPWRLTSKVKADSSVATLDEVSFQYGPDERALTLAGSGEFKFGAQPQLQGSFRRGRSTSTGCWRHPRRRGACRSRRCRASARCLAMRCGHRGR